MITKQQSNEFVKDSGNESNDESKKGLLATMRTSKKFKALISGLIGLGMGTGVFGCSEEKKVPQNNPVKKTQELNFHQKQTFPKDTPTVGQTVKKDNLIEINENVINATREAFFKNYINNPGSLKEAYSRMGPWENILKKIFEEEGVPKEFIYLAITESEADPFRISPVKAVGPYQIMKKTARDHCTKNNSCLIMDGLIDERRDFIKSGRFCAKYLKDAYNRTSSKEIPENRWKLALSSYNGGFFWSFISKTKKENVTLENFNQYIEDNLKLLQDKARNSAIKYTVKSGDTIKSISEKYKVSVDKIKKYNKIKGYLKKGQKITLPLSNERIFEMRAKFYRENLRYPPKLLAALDAISYFKNKEGKLKQESELEYITTKINGYIFNKKYFFNKKYIVKKGENINSIAKKLKIDANLLAAENNLYKGEKLPFGKKLNYIKIVLKKERATFFDYYKSEFNKGSGFSPETFAVLNAKYNKNDYIPVSGVEIKYPKLIQKNKNNSKIVVKNK